MKTIKTYDIGKEKRIEFDRHSKSSAWHPYTARPNPRHRSILSSMTFGRSIHPSIHPSIHAYLSISFSHTHHDVSNAPPPTATTSTPHERKKPLFWQSSSVHFTRTHHVSPNNMIVPVPPFQHSPILGHFASSQTVWRNKSRSDSLTVWYRLVLFCDGAGTRNQSGRPMGISAPTLGRRNNESDVSSSSSLLLVPSFFLFFMGNPPPPVDPSPRRIA